MPITSSQITEYFNNIGLAVGTDNYNLFNKLMLIDSILYKDVLEKLISNTITLNQLKQLESINDRTIEKFLYDISGNHNDAAIRREYFITNLKENHSLNTMKEEAMSEFTKYVYRKNMEKDSFGRYVEIDPLGIKDKSYTSFFKARERYLYLMNFNNSDIMEKYNLFLDYHNSISFSTYAIESIKILIDLAMSEPVFLKSIYNINHYYTNYDIYLYLLKKLYLHTSPGTFNVVYSEYLNDMVNNYDNDVTGLNVIETKVNDIGWIDLINISKKGDIFTIFDNLKLKKYYFPSLYPNQSAVDLLSQKAIIDNYKEYFELASNVLLAISDKIKNNMDPV